MQRSWGVWLLLGMLEELQEAKIVGEGRVVRRWLGGVGLHIS